MEKTVKPKRQRLPTYLREWRKFKDLTQDELAEALDLDKTTLSRIERGLLPYNQDMIEGAAIFLGCRPDDLIAHPPYSEPKIRQDDVSMPLDREEVRSVLEIFASMICPNATAARALAEDALELLEGRELPLGVDRRTALRVGAHMLASESAKKSTK